MARLSWKHCTSALATALLVQQLPPLSMFLGETTGNTDEADAGKQVEDWLEQFEMVATMCKCDEEAKLANLAMRLRGGRPSHSIALAHHRYRPGTLLS